MIKEPKIDPIPAPDPAHPTVAAPAPINLAAESISLLTADVWKLRLTTGLTDEVAIWLRTADNLAQDKIFDNGVTAFEQVYILAVLIFEFRETFEREAFES